MCKSTEYSFGTLPQSFHYITFNTFINLQNKHKKTWVKHIKNISALHINACSHECTIQINELSHPPISLYFCVFRIHITLEFLLTYNAPNNNGLVWSPSLKKPMHTMHHTDKYGTMLSVRCPTYLANVKRSRSRRQAQSIYFILGKCITDSYTNFCYVKLMQHSTVNSYVTY